MNNYSIMYLYITILNKCINKIITVLQNHKQWGFIFSFWFLFMHTSVKGTFQTLFQKHKTEEKNNTVATIYGENE